jgi:hypothetical protein
MEIKPIETEYKGCRFRSRLEARWAVFFDTLGIKWEYEKEGFELGNGERYLPDFWLPDLGEGIWFEVKGEIPTEDDVNKLLKVCDGTNKHGLIAWGTMDVPLIYNREEKIYATGAIILNICPTSSFKAPMQECQKESNFYFLANLARSRVQGFFEDITGKITYDSLYKDDTEFTQEASVFITETYFFAMVDGIPQLLSCQALNLGCGRKFRSHKLKRAYKTARSARFERF